ncbi:MAG: class I adenylate-forming enzyme family protein [Pirellulales bacterium]
MLGDAILDVAGRMGDRDSTIHEGRSLSYRQLIDSSLRLASVFCSKDSGLNAQSSAREGKSKLPVAIQLGNCVDYPIVVTALAILGIPILPVHCQWNPDETLRSLGGRKISGLIGDSVALEKWRGFSTRTDLELMEIGNLRSLASDASLLDMSKRIPPQEGDEALCLMTSGTTSAPKLVIRSHGNLLNNSKNVGESLGWKKGARVLPVTPFHHANGFSNGLLLPILRGACTVILSTFFPSKLVAMVREESVNVLVASPIVYSSLLSYPEATASMQGLSQAISSGAALPLEVVTEAHRRWGLQIRELYGSSETGTISIEPVRSTPSLRSVGVAVPGVEIGIHSETGENLPAGEIGLIAVRSAAIMQGYWRPDGVQSACNSEGWYYTGDFGTLQHDQSIQLHGRRRKFINSGGNKIDPLEIEEVLNRFPNIRRSVVFGQPHSRLGEVVHATVFLAPMVEVDQKEIYSYLHKALADYKIPRVLQIKSAAVSNIPDKNS